MTPDEFMASVLLVLVGVEVLRRVLAWVARRVIGLTFGWVFRRY